MHAAYDIGNDDLRDVLSTFVVMPVRWNAAYGWRPLTEVETRRPAYAPAVICEACRESEHERCPGGSWCDCQHRAPGPVEPVTGPPGE